MQEVALVELQVSVELPPLDTEVGPALRVTAGAAVGTVIVVDWTAEPPAPVQVSAYLVDALSTFVLCEPLVAWLPLHPPEAVHDVALVDDQLNVDRPPLATVLGDAASVTAGAGVATVTVADCVVLPPAPAQVSVYVELPVIDPVDCDPLGPRVPDHEPEAVQAVAFWLVHVMFEAPLDKSVLGLACTDTMGESAPTVTVVDWVAEPPGPVQVNANSAVLVTAPVW
jgi:hypothetical protein